MATISEFVADNRDLLTKTPGTILAFFQEIERNPELLGDYKTLLRGSTPRSVNSQIGRRVCATLAGKAIGRQKAAGTGLIGSFSVLSF
jgi:hypothetical protein